MTSSPLPPNTPPATQAQPAPSEPPTEQARVTVEELERESARLENAGRTRDALAALRQLCQLAPARAPAWERLGRLAALAWRFGEAEQALRQALALEPDNLVNLNLLAYVLREMGKTEESLTVSAQVLRRDPNNLAAAVSQALTLPQVYPSGEALAQWRRRFTQGLATLTDTTRLQNRSAEVLTLQWGNFHLAYQGQDDRELQEAYSAWIHHLLSQALPELQQPRPRRKGSIEKIRVGFVSSFFRTCTVGAYFGSWIRDLPRQRFEVYTFFAGHQPDAVTADLAAASDRFITLRGRPDHCARQISEAALDILIYPEVGMDVSTYLLSNLRLAPVQAAAWGHPVTTGSREIDFFFSCDAMEPPGAQTHYTERLVLLPGLGVCYQRPEPPPPLERAELKLPQDRPLYLCSQSLHKIHPDNDALFVELMARDPEGVLLFFSPAWGQHAQHFAKRLERALGAAKLPQRQQVKMLPFLPWPLFRAVNAAADVMLDTLHWSGGQTTLDALAVGLPPVTLPGRLMRSRQSQAMLRIVGVPELIAENREAYLQKALRIAHDPDHRNTLVTKIRAGLPRLFDRQEPIQALAEKLEQALAGGEP